ncbi:dimethylamine monooxygenase subunit DmmA family protein [Arthrobacter sp. W4I7]|uniref:dimethylamine monooxygenase subunit DmmA family protein n=1 Tax=Arthrobacter sp. W4I7 TaxID=3042296 RepID=UPI0027D7EA82|nr:dimethylamine monooxygenase subunit DmmA family protein [Arthrobacter sp. W4I7]
MSFTPAGAQIAEVWLEESNPETPRRHMRANGADGETMTQLENLLRSSRVGVHFVFSGPQADIYTARARAIDNGAIDAEITLLESVVGNLHVYCAHCKETTSTGNGIGATVRCGGCARQLVVYHHFSRRTSSYLGFMANAEEVS